MKLLMTVLCVCILHQTHGITNDPKPIIKNFLKLNCQKYLLNHNDVKQWEIVRNTYSPSTNISEYKIQQLINGYKIEDAISVIWIRNQNVINFVNRFISIDNKFLQNDPNKISKEQAIKIAFPHIKKNKQFCKIDINYYLIEQLKKKKDLIEINRVFYQTSHNKLNLVWKIINKTSFESKNILIDTKTGTQHR